MSRNQIGTCSGFPIHDMHADASVILDLGKRKEVETPEKKKKKRRMVGQHSQVTCRLLDTYIQVL